MSTQHSVQRDERTVAIENASSRWVCNLLIFALLIDVIFRGIVRHEGAWDLMALIIVGGVVQTMYQAHQRVLGRVWLKMMLIAACTAAVVAFVLATRKTM